mmetsp:Transcript_56955/g.78984  ORF Transcript_56955/g.78984 Transcript_56955/m.78984 type:complete len:246 (-) Transcript_56955:47-784(-)
MVLVFILELLRSILKGFGLIILQSLQAKLVLVLEEGSQLEVILGVKGALDGDVVLEELQEFLLKLVDFFSDEEGVNEGKIGVGQVLVIPHLLSHHDGAKEQRSPIGGVEGHASKGNEPVDIHQADNAALRRELSAIEESLHKLVDVVYGGSGSQQSLSLLVKLLWLLLNIFLLTEEVQVRLGVKLLSRVLILQHLRMQNSCDSMNDSLHIRLGNSRSSTSVSSLGELINLGLLLIDVDHFLDLCI